MDPWIQQDFPLNVVDKPSLTSTDYLTNQANSLVSQLYGRGQSNFLAVGVGHSNGGLIVRDVAFRYPNLLNRIITLDATNNGAEMTEFDKAALAGAMRATSPHIRSVPKPPCSDITSRMWS